MQTKFDQLPNAIKGEISKYLPTRDFLNLVEASKRNHTLFTSNNYLKRTIEIRKFLHHVVRGNHDAVAEILSKNPAFIVQRGQVTDLSGRTFTNISGFEYALWALDKHLWTKMLACLPENEDCERIKTELWDQYQNVKEQGVTYTLNGQTKTEAHFDFKNTIINELQTYVIHGGNNQWITGVGGAQRLLPMHVVFEYCGEELFFPVPSTFTQQPKSSKQFYNWETDKYEFWFCEGSKLGIDFALQRGVNTRPATSKGPAWNPLPTHCSELNALKALCQVRTNDFNDLADVLKPGNLLDNQYKI